MKFEAISTPTRKNPKMFKLLTSCRAAIAVGAMIVATSAFAEEATFATPKVGSQPLDLCLAWGVDCGKPAADAWCTTQGYVESTSHVVANDIGAATPTRLLTTGAVCDQAFCDGFASITCAKPDPVTQVYAKPKIGGNRLDWCVDWGVGCGEPAATAFCQAEGWVQAIDFAIANDIGASKPTRLIGTGAVCDQGFCDGFAKITCGS